MMGFMAPNLTTSPELRKLVPGPDELMEQTGMRRGNRFPNFDSGGRVLVMRAIVRCLAAALPVMIVLGSSAQTPPENPELRTLLARSVAVRPSERQISWQRREFIA